MLRFPLAATLLFLITFAVYAQPYAPAGYEAVLVPTALQAPGANGSYWTSELWILNDNALPSTEWHRDNCHVCPGTTPGNTARQLQAVSASGLLLYFPAAELERLHFSLRVRDTSRNAGSAGAEIPVVRVSSLKSGPVHLLNVPTAPRFRVTVRVYDPDYRAGTAIVRCFSPDHHEIVREVPVSLTGQRIFPGSPPRLASLGGSLLDLSPLHDRGLTSTNLEITSVDAAGETGTARLWAFVSITDNETQQVTVIAQE